MQGLSRERLTETELQAGLSQLDGWSSDGQSIGRQFEFAAYKDGLAFATAVGWEADKMDHHPDLFVGYRKVRVSLSTHDADGVTAHDLELARRIDRLASKD